MFSIIHIPFFKGKPVERIDEPLHHFVNFNAIGCSINRLFVIITRAQYSSIRIIDDNAICGKLRGNKKKI